MKIEETNQITEGPIWKSILSFFFPIMLGMFFQQLYNTVDSVIVGRFIGKEALAAVGGGSGFYVNLLVGFFGGLSSGAGIIISQFFGAKRGTDLSLAIHTSVFLSIIMGLAMTVLGIFLAPVAMKIISTPEEIYSNAVLYLQIFFAGVLPMFLYNMGAGILRAIGDSRTPFTVLVISCFTNIILDILFVTTLNMGVDGVAWATVISQTISMILIFLPLIKTDKSWNFSVKKLRCNPYILKKMIQLGIPSGLYSSMYTVSNLILMSFINAFGTTTIAAWTVWGKLDALFWMTVNAFGMSLTTFSGQNYGAGKLDRIKKGTIQGLFIIYGVTVIIIAVFWLWGEQFYTWFIPGETETIRIGMEILKFLTPAFFVYIPIELLSGTIRGAGKTLVPMFITFFGICGTRILWLFTVGTHTTVFLHVISSYPISWIISSAIFFIYYKREKWLEP